MDVFVVLECEIFLPNSTTMTYFDTVAQKSVSVISQILDLSYSWIMD
jgi:hypothetical protein